MRDELEYKGSNVPPGFAAGCRQCECENIYPVTDVQVFEGEPRKRKVTEDGGRRVESSDVRIVDPPNENSLGGATYVKKCTDSCCPHAP